MLNRCTKLNAERDEKERKREHDLEKARILNQTERERIKRKHELEEADRRRKHESIEADKKRQHDKDEAERRRKHEAHEADKKRRHDIEEAERRRKHESSENDKQRQHELNMERVKDARTKDYRALIDQLKNWDTDRLPYAIQLLNSLGAFPKGERTGIQEVGSFDDDEESHHVREYYY